MECFKPLQNSKATKFTGKEDQAFPIWTIIRSQVFMKSVQPPHLKNYEISIIVGTLAQQVTTTIYYQV